MTNLQAYTRIALALLAFWLAVAWMLCGRKVLDSTTANIRQQRTP